MHYFLCKMCTLTIHSRTQILTWLSNRELKLRPLLSASCFLYFFIFTYCSVLDIFWAFLYWKQHRSDRFRGKVRLEVLSHRFKFQLQLEFGIHLILWLNLFRSLFLQLFQMRKIGFVGVRTKWNNVYESMSWWTFLY